MVQTELEEAGFSVNPLRKMMAKRQEMRDRMGGNQEQEAKRDLLKDEIAR